MTHKTSIRFLIGNNIGTGFTPSHQFYVYPSDNQTAEEECNKRLQAYKQKWQDISPSSPLQEIRLEFASTIKVTDGFWNNSEKELPSPPPFYIPKEIQEAQKKIQEYEKLIQNEWIDPHSLQYQHTDDVWFQGSPIHVGEHEKWRGNCLNDLLERGKHTPLHVKRTGDRGYGLFSADRIEAHTLLFQYAGEILYNHEAMQRERDYQFWAGTDFHIDAKDKGNLSRFINHICDGKHSDCNVAVDLIEDTETGIDGFFRILLYTKRNIEPNKELLFNYRAGVVKRLSAQEREEYEKGRMAASTNNIVCRCVCSEIHINKYPFVF